MSTLKRKDAPGGDSPAKSAKKTREARPSKDTAGNDAKPTTKKPKAANATPVVSVLKDEEPMFPRGGGSVLTPLEHKQIQLEAKADAREEEFNTSGKALKKKKRKATLEKSEKGKKGVAVEDEEDSIKVESLNFKVCG